MSEPAAILENEKELFNCMSKGDEQAFTKIFAYYEPFIYPFIFKLTRSALAAEEIVQELFIKLWTSKENMSQVENHRSYIFRMAANRSVNYLKKLANDTQLVKTAAQYIPTNSNNTEELLDLHQTEKTIQLAIGSLTQQQKTVYQLSRQQGLKNHEIAALLQISEKTVKNHLTHALHHIKIYLNKSAEAKVALLLFIAAQSN
ncbi:MAG: RNA polymerase sigma-70 factor [Bacteroidetes bacterium]|nr:RNA polymerase sigma-70 factor [Bacteroidota bacterium]